MKIKLFYLAYIIVILSACSKEEGIPVRVDASEGSLTFTSEGQSRKIAVKSNASWKITGTNDWCTVSKSEGQNDDSVTVTVKTNIIQDERSVIIYIGNSDARSAVKVIQQGATQEYTYQLPIIFHVLYNNPADRNQNIDQATLRKLIADCNAQYGNTSTSVDMNLEFVPATTDPQGKPLPEPGINRMQWPQSIVMDCLKFMDNGQYADLMWNQNEYINIFIYTFTSKYTLGISHLAYTVSSNRLEGLYSGDYFLTHEPHINHCLSLNNDWIYKEEGITTLAHEMGHYLGLFHVFSDSTCSNTDYCGDTPNYNRKVYEEWLSSLPQEEFTWQNVIKRTSCEGKSFISYNIMDYDYTYQNQFTPDQRKRVRLVLEYSPLVPGPKAERTVTRGHEVNVQPKSQVII